jgi:hypothetical protein
VSTFQAVVDWLVIVGYLVAFIGGLAAFKIVRRFKNPLAASPKGITGFGQQMSGSLLSATLSDQYPAPKE